MVISMAFNAFCLKYEFINPTNYADRRLAGLPTLKCLERLVSASVCRIYWRQGAGVPLPFLHQFPILILQRRATTDDHRGKRKKRADG